MTTTILRKRTKSVLSDETNARAIGLRITVFVWGQPVVLKRLVFVTDQRLFALLETQE